MERVIVLTECGKVEGFGHFFRTCGMVQFLREHGYKVDYLLLNSDGVIPTTDITYFKIESHEDVDRYLTKKSAIIIDSYKTTESQLLRWKSMCAKMLCFDDYSRITYPDYILNGAPYANDLFYSGNRAHHLLGSQYLILRKEFLNIRPRECALEVKNVFVMLGGTGSQESLERILKNIKKFPYDFHIVGPKVIESENFTYYQNLGAAEMALLMRRCEVAISASGQTLFELCYQGVPAILFKVAENQTWNLKWAKGIGMLEGDFERIDTQLLELVEYQKRYEIYKNIIQVVSSKGVINVINTFLPLVFHVRKAQECDEMAIFHLSNQEYVRKVSLNKNKIKLEEHQNWFRNKLEANVPFYIIEDIDGTFLGQIRYQIEDNMAEISLSFSTILKDRGLSKQVTEKSMKMLFDEYKVSVVVAYLYEENIASKKLFEGLGFDYIGNESGVLRYEWRK